MGKTCPQCGHTMAYIPSSNMPYWKCPEPKVGGGCGYEMPATKEDANENEKCNLI